MARSDEVPARQEGARAPDEPKGIERIFEAETGEAEESEEGPPGSDACSGVHAASQPLAPPCSGTEQEEAGEGSAVERSEGAQPEGPERPSTPAPGEGMHGDSGKSVGRPLAPPCSGTEQEEAGEGPAAERSEGAQPEGPERPSTPAPGDAGDIEGDSTIARREGTPPDSAESPSAPAVAESTNGLQPAPLGDGEACCSDPPLPSPKPSLKGVFGGAALPDQEGPLIPALRRQREARQGDESDPGSPAAGLDQELLDEFLGVEAQGSGQGARPRREDGVEVSRKMTGGAPRSHRRRSLLTQGKEGPPEANQECSPTDAGEGNFDFYSVADDDIKDDEITRLQAILCDLPKHGLYSPESRDFACCGVGGIGAGGHARSVVPAIDDDEDMVSSSNGVIFTAADAIEVALIESSVKYPGYAHVLRRLVVEYADADIAILADHETQRLFLSVRGTDPFTARDLGNDALVFLGMSPVRMEMAKRAYAEIKHQFPNYASYGCGHSLGGTIMHDLACDVSKDDGLCFERVDVFNAGGSPLRYKRVASLKETRFHAHRVRGDLVSLYYEPPRASSPKARSRKIEHPLNPSVSAHRLGHFLPRRRTTMNIIEDKVTSIFALFCMASRDDCRALY